MSEAKMFPNVGWIETETPDIFKDAITKEVQTPGEDWRSELAGHTNGANLLPGLMADSAYESWLIDLAKQYDGYFPAYRKTICHHMGMMNLRLGDVWVNFSKQHDFNPMHWHGGVFSFVTWVSIPYDQDKERAGYDCNNPGAAEFSFTITDVLGQIYDHTVEQKEWTTLFFPANMRHKVHPYFTTDKIRISIAGNLLLQ